MRAFFVVILTVWTAMHIYVFWRTASVPVIARRVPRWALWSAAFVLWASYIAARILEHVGLGIAARILEIAGADWIGVLFLLLVSLLAVDVVTVFGRVLPRFAPSLRGWALLAGGLLSAIALVQGHRAPVVDNYEVRMAGLPAALDGMVIVVASDFHLGTQLGKGWLEARIQQVEAEHPDLIILAGDIVEGDYAAESDLLPPLRKLRAGLGVWGVTGNHEFHAETQGGSNVLETNGVRLLHDRWAEIAPGLILAGVDDLTSRHRHGGDTASSMQRALQGRPAGVTTILISHTPWEVEAAARSGVGLMLSSHTHDGQIWPFSYIVGLSYPFLAGRYEVAGMPIIVCRGTGTWGPRMRLWRRGEILRITLRSTAAS